MHTCCLGYLASSRMEISLQHPEDCLGFLMRVLLPFPSYLPPSLRVNSGFPGLPSKGILSPVEVLHLAPLGWIEFRGT